MSRTPISALLAHPSVAEPVASDWQPVIGETNFQLILNVGYMAPAYELGDTVYCAPVSRVHANHDYLLASRSKGDRRLVLVRIERATASTWYAVMYSWCGVGHKVKKIRIRLSRAKWAPAFVVRYVAFTGRRKAA